MNDECTVTITAKDGTVRQVVRQVHVEAADLIAVYLTPEDVSEVGQTFSIKFHGSGSGE